MRRAEQREWVFKLIYQDSISEIENLDESLENLSIKDETFIKKSLESYLGNKDKIDSKLEENLLKGHKNLAKVLRAILYLSINEIYFMDIPVSVSINEAVNLSKKYSNEEDYKLVNSILGSIIRKDEK
ncbi:MAG: transcription antitermination factor NusB [Anaerococcus sp.]|nr:transcription antitermination factor NusB [Anaerococcus sp.]